MPNALLSDNPEVIAKGLKNAIAKDLKGKDDKKKRAEEGIRYYNYDHDILKNRIMYIDDNGNLKEDRYASNINIQHPFLNELVDQVVEYLLSNPVEIECEDDRLKELLEDYYDEDFQLFLHDLVENGCQKGFEYVYARTTEDDKLTFDIADGLKIVPIYDDSNRVARILRYYKEDIYKDGKSVEIKHAEVFTTEQIYYFVATNEKDTPKAAKDEYQLDPDKLINPSPIVPAVSEDGETVAGRDYGRLPFYRYKNNQKERTDLEPIKSLIDDYDLMNTFLSNNLQDFADAIYVVKGFEGDNLDKLRFNLKNKKTVGVGESGGVDIQTVDIPVSGRETKMRLDRENIYKFGFGFDSSQIGDGNITNVVIKGRYTLLNMKANKKEVRLKAFLKWANELVIADINRLNKTSYDPKQVEFVITREMLVNENDIVTNEKTEADKRSVEVQTLLAAAPLLPDDEVVKMICEIYDLDYDEVQAQMDEQGYKEPALPEPAQEG